MSHGNSTREMRMEAMRMFDEGRDEEAREIFRKLKDTQGVAELAYRALWRNSMSELMDVAYDFEDVIDDLVLRSAAKQRSGGNWERCILVIRIHKKLEMIKSKIPHLPPAQVLVPLSSRIPKYLEEMEWSPLFSIPSQNLEDIVVSPVKEKLSALLVLMALHPDTKKKARRVLDELESLSSFLKGLELVYLDDKAGVWMEKLSDVSLSAVVVIEDFINNNQQLRKKSWMGSPFGKSKSQHDFGMKMDKIYAKIQELSISKPEKATQVQGQSREFIKSEKHIPSQQTTQNPHLASFDDDVHAMTTRLLAADKSFRVIPIMGMEGIGKTTLAKLIFHNKAVVDHFPFRAWPSTTASSTIGDSRQILLDIIKQLMNYKMRVTRGAVVSSEHEEMMQKLKAFLINNRSRMIWITRKMSLPPNLKTRSDPHPLRLRADEESWALFTHALKKDATIEEWSRALQQLCHDQEKVWSNTLCRIYKDLSLYMRRCLFSLTLFPHDSDTPTRRLITLWVAEDLVQTEGRNEAPEDVAESCLNLLIAQGMVQLSKKKLNGNVKTVRLPDALTQYWLSKAQRARALGDHIYTRSELFPGNDMIRRLVDHLDRNDITFDHIHGEEIGDFLRRCISSSCFLSLWVLDLENVYKPKLPEALGELTQLRYLGLRSTFLEKLPSSISKLRNLQTLDIKHTNIKTLPISICKLQQLRHLYLSEGYRSKLMLRPSTGSLTTLQTLCGLFVDEETPVRDGLNRLLNLRKLGLAMSSQPKATSSQVQAVTDWILNLKHLQSLRVKSIDDNNQPWDLELKPLTGHQNLSCIFLFGRLRNPSIVSQFPPSLIDLTLSGSELTKDPMESLGKLPNLRSLKLFAKSYLGKSMHCSLGGFRQLRVLKLWKLDQLEDWKVEKGALQALRDLEIRYSERTTPTLPEELLDRSPLLKIDVKLAQNNGCDYLFECFGLLLHVELCFSFQCFDIGADIQIILVEVSSKLQQVMELIWDWISIPSAQSMVDIIYSNGVLGLNVLIFCFVSVFRLIGITMQKASGSSFP
ncbi:Disease resistance protein RPM1 [Vitis vinifera]|uniref:Disease resistance protein RPM1 n=1 Tax=Vitis vinifera TaxID=29760 RepID=A0A438I5F7_VITVI|nr:Disease resistance protein RPM1 [Vitis vinifera]